ncbi:MAG: hypothetical protein LQ339_004804 [Xanthoria mediterranea]|nr:MAG: hypothetical protein LQ339_004804 [Xanthoria mediterranea]
MSASAVPISQDRFAEAIADLPIGNLHAKASELRNSIAHLLHSNEQLQRFADDGDRDCADAIKENRQVMTNMIVRIDLLRREVENRGLPWGADEPASVNGNPEGQTDQDSTPMEGEISSSQRSHPDHQFRTDADLAQRLREQMDEDTQADDGVHL